MPKRENIVIGDAHGCIDEFNQLLDKINYDVKKHRVILVGDILDRGEDPIGLLHQVQSMKIESVLGNHEEKALRWRKHEALRELTGRANPMKKITAQRAKEWLSLSKNDLQWLMSLPLKLHVKDNWYVVHAGMEPSVSFEKQDNDRIIRIRYVDENSNISKARPTKEKPILGIHFWADRWQQPYNIIFGHHRFDKPMLFKNSNNMCVGIDTSCVYGNMLTAYHVEKNEFTHVKAKKVYYKK